MGRSLVHMDDSGEDILLSNTLRNEVKSRLEIRFLFLDVYKRQAFKVDLIGCVFVTAISRPPPF